ncbi:hypothetical protein SNE35_17930 [Paucibacter sp. R3-3]|uniref:PEP-CTERM sorting domain-containing protein n=1 Tax=Roseateles agri TaxID=3098619 RepID=A0ABU5DMW2_9BURK|nr:hypothetical protein [Paucibacter sp. R3-3]MDY0746397.1 hypothetical protein [Paucibacter sp. R3-3]
MKLLRVLRTPVAVLGLLVAAAATAVTIPDDPVPHLWHSSTTPANAFQGAAGYTGAAWNNTDAGALYVEWGGFIPAARNTWTFSTPTVGVSSNLTAVLKETSGSGLLTGANNIYGLAFGQVPGVPLVFDLALSVNAAAIGTADQVRTVVMRSGTLGTLPDMNVTLNGVAATAYAATFRVDGTIDMPTGPGGALEPNPSSSAEWLWLWDNVPAAASYRLAFKAQVGHMSLDNLVVYASPPRTPPPVPTARAPVVIGDALAALLAATTAERVTTISATRKTPAASSATKRTR